MQRLSSFGFAILVLSGAVSCGKPSAAPRSAEKPPSAEEFARLAGERDKAFFARVVRQELGDKCGMLLLRPQGILIHPGETTPSTVTFRLSGEFKSLEVKLTVATDEKVRGAKEVSTVNVYLLGDGKELYRSFLDYTSNVVKKLDVSGVQEFTVRVDNADGKTYYDWFFLSVQSMS